MKVEIYNENPEDPPVDPRSRIKGKIYAFNKLAMRWDGREFLCLCGSRKRTCGNCSSPQVKKKNKDIKDIEYDEKDVEFIKSFENDDIDKVVKNEKILRLMKKYNNITRTADMEKIMMSFAIYMASYDCILFNYKDNTKFSFKCFKSEHKINTNINKVNVERRSRGHKIERNGHPCVECTKELVEQKLIPFGKESHAEERGRELAEKMGIKYHGYIGKYERLHIVDCPKCKEKTEIYDLLFKEDWNICIKCKMSEFIKRTDNFEETIKEIYEHKSTIEETVITRMRVNKRAESTGNKIFTFPSGRVIVCEGNEIDYLQEMENNYKEDDIISSVLEVPSVSYPSLLSDNIYLQRSNYFPDFYIKSLNLMIEVKADFTLRHQFANNMLKIKSALLNGFNIELWEYTARRFTVWLPKLVTTKELYYDTTNIGVESEKISANKYKKRNKKVTIIFEDDNEEKKEEPIQESIYKQKYVDQILEWKEMELEDIIISKEFKRITSKFNITVPVSRGKRELVDFMILLAEYKCLLFDSLTARNFKYKCFDNNHKHNSMATRDNVEKRAEHGGHPCTFCRLEVSILENKERPRRKDDNKRYTYEKVYNIFKEKGCLLLNDKYVNNKQRLNYICMCGREVNKSLGSFLINYKCKDCNKPLEITFED